MSILTATGDAPKAGDQESFLPGGINETALPLLEGSVTGAAGFGAASVEAGAAAGVCGCCCCCEVLPLE